MNVKNPDGKERVLPELSHNIAAEVMEEAKKTYDAAEKHRERDWSSYSSLFHRATLIENAAIQVQKVLTAG